MNKKPMTAILSLFLIVFYCAIILLVTFPVLEINLLENYVVALTFDILSFCVLAILILTNILYKPIKTGYFVPLISLTIIYIILSDIVNLGVVFVASKWIFLLINMILFFGYCIISIPMYIMGRRSE